MLVDTEGEEVDVVVGEVVDAQLGAIVQSSRSFIDHIA